MVQIRTESVLGGKGQVTSIWTEQTTLENKGYKLLPVVCCNVLTFSWKHLHPLNRQITPPAHLVCAASTWVPEQCGSLALSDVEIEILTKTTERLTATRTTLNHVQRSQPSSTPFTVLGLKPLSLYLPAPKIFQAKSLLKKGKLPSTKHHSSNPKRRAFNTSDKVEATCLVLKGLFPWQQESQGSRTVHTEPSSSCPKVPEFRSTCSATLALGREDKQITYSHSWKIQFSSELHWYEHR